MDSLPDQQQNVTEARHGVDVRHLARRILPLFVIAAFGVAIWILTRALEPHHLTEIRRYIVRIRTTRLEAAAGLSAASYVALIGYDLLALRYVDRRVPLGTTVLTSFISYAFSNNIGAGGFGVLTGASVRYRLYATAGLSGFEITAVIGFCLITFFVGVLLVGGMTLMFRPEALAALEHIPAPAVRVAGIAMCTCVLAYLLWGLLRRRPLVIGKWRMRPPGLGLAIGQLVVSGLDFVFAGAALYVLMPATGRMTLAAFLPVYVVALVAGVISHVPAGLGVFESLLIVLLPNVPPPQAIGALLLYRVAYYLLPLTAAAAMLIVSETVARWRSVSYAAGTLAAQLVGIVPQFSAFGVFLGGTVLLVSGATPAIDERIFRISQILPLPVLEVSHLIGSVAGIGLLFLARGLLRRLDGAYMLTLGLLLIGAIASLLKGLDYEEAGLMILLAILLLPARPAFYRHAVFTRQPFSGPWVTGVAVIVLGSIWLGYFSYRHVGYAHSLWWQFEFFGNAPRFLRATLAVVVVGMAAAVAQLLRPVPPIPPIPGPDRVDQLLPLVAASPNSRAALALMGDKHILFSEAGDGFIMYGVRGRSWVAMGDPVGPPEMRGDLVWRFRELCDLHDGLPVFYQIDAENLPLYVDLGLTILKLGDEARIDLASFDLEMPQFKDLRYARRRAIRDGASFAVNLPPHAPGFMAETRQVSDAWLATQKSPEKGFSVGGFQETYLAHFPVAVIYKEGRIVAFSNLWLGAQKHEVSVDLMRYRPQEIYGVMDYLLLELIAWSRRHGYRWFNLGVAPLSGLEARHLSPVWYRLGALAYRFGDQFYNFQGLRRYKDKFAPQWRPKFLACPGGLTLGRVLLDVATLISGGVGGLIRR